MHREGRNRPVDTYLSHIGDQDIDRIQEEQLGVFAPLVHIVKNAGEVGEQRQEDAIQIRDVPEEHIPAGEDHSYADIERCGAQDRENEEQIVPGDRQSVQNAEEEEYEERQKKIDESRDVPGKDEEIFWDIDLLKNGRVIHEALHPGLGRVFEIRHEDRARKEKDRVVRCGSSEKAQKNKTHHKKSEERVQDAPQHSQDGPFVLLLEIPFYQLLEKKTLIGKGEQDISAFFTERHLR